MTRKRPFFKASMPYGSKRKWVYSTSGLSISKRLSDEEAPAMKAMKKAMKAMKWSNGRSSRWWQCWQRLGYSSTQVLRQFMEEFVAVLRAVRAVYSGLHVVTYTTCAWKNELTCDAECHVICSEWLCSLQGARLNCSQHMSMRCLYSTLCDYWQLKGCTGMSALCFAGMPQFCFHQMRQKCWIAVYCCQRSQNGSSKKKSSSRDSERFTSRLCIDRPVLTPAPWVQDRSGPDGRFSHLWRPPDGTWAGFLIQQFSFDEMI